jgi:hypothetical protein
MLCGLRSTLPTSIHFAQIHFASIYFASIYFAYIHCIVLTNTKFPGKGLSRSTRHEDWEGARCDTCLGISSLLSSSSSSINPHFQIITLQFQTSKFTFVPLTSHLCVVHSHWQNLLDAVRLHPETWTTNHQQHSIHQTMKCPMLMSLQRSERPAMASPKRSFAIRLSTVERPRRPSEHCSLPMARPVPDHSTIPYRSPGMPTVKPSDTRK